MTRIVQIDTNVDFYVKQGVAKTESLQLMDGFVSADLTDAELSLLVKPYATVGDVIVTPVEIVTPDSGLINITIPLLTYSVLNLERFVFVVRMTKSDVSSIILNGQILVDRF